MHKNNIVYCCMDCGDKISYEVAVYRGARCRSCARKFQYKNDITTNPGYVDGRSKNKNFCCDCDKKISYNAIRCRSCRNKGDKHPRFKGGKDRFPNCVICQTKLSGLDHKICKNCFKGANTPNWTNGNSLLPYPIEFTYYLKRKIRERDNFKCQNCELSEKEHHELYNQNLHVHHIDYNKFNCYENNLITVCKKCNNNANANRDYWFAYYTYIMENFIL